MDAVLTKEPTAPAADVEEMDVEEMDVEEEDEAEEVEGAPKRVARALSATFHAALPYVVGIQAMKSLALGTWVIARKTVVWIIDGDALEIFAPGIVRKRKAKAAAAKKAKAAPARVGGKAKAGASARRPKGSGAKRPPASAVKEKPAPQTQPQQAEGKELPGWMLRLGGLLFGGFLVVYYLPHNPAIWMPIVLVPWAAAAWVYAPLPAPKAEKPKPEQEQEQPEEEQEEAFEDDPAGEQRVLSPEQIADRFRMYVEHAVAARYAEGVRGIRQGVHLEDMLADLKQRGLIADPAWDTTALAAYFRRIGIPLRDPLPLTVAGKKRNRIGVDFKELSAALGREPLLPPHLVPDNTPQEAPAGPPPGASSTPSRGVPEGARSTPAKAPREMAG
ncbi:hypothetical protein [Kitasatospora sp. MBT63]|uniref:hypothetical protein n=1 Tax=Kitasatospora sp. MBT63 TaxID=1444768 RepID=UPI0011EA6BA2|nr:hypothetical protein [Kitasatospora sp. MBT63]